MKKLVLLLLTLGIVSQQSNAQKVYAWMDCGAKIGYGLTGIINKNILDDKDYEHHLNGGLTVGGKVGFFMGLYNGITCDVMFSSNKQKFDYTLSSTQKYDHTIDWKNLDVAVMYRLQRNSNYIEVGPMMSLLKKAKNTDTNPLNAIPENTKSYFEKKYYSAVLGFGGYIFGNEVFTAMLGLRMGYGLTDMFNAAGKEVRYPTPNGAVKYTEDKSSNAAFVQLMLEGNFALGYYGKTSCAKRAHIMRFGE